MNVTKEALHRIDKHWTVSAIGSSERERGIHVSNNRLVQQAIGDQVVLDFDDVGANDELLTRLALAYEMAAIEGLKAFLKPALSDRVLQEQCAAGAWRAFEFRRLFNIPTDEKERVFHVLHLSALAYCGDRWSDLRRWYTEHDSHIRVPSVADTSWEYRLIYRLFDCWIRLFRKRQWDDLDRVREIIAGLREDQKVYEAGALQNGSNAEDRVKAFHLVALYHWAKATELLAKYMLQGEPASISTLLDKHFETAADAAAGGLDSRTELLFRWLHAASRQMVSGSIWWVARPVNSRVTKFVKEVTKQRAMFELLPPQRAALLEQGLLDQAATAIVIDMPTSGGKTLLAQFKILQALNQFDVERGWVAYVAPTRALSAQITRRLRRDFEPIGIKVEQLTGAVEIDTLEDDLLSRSDNGVFDVLVATPEKLHLVLKNNKVPRPLALLVLDEAHNIEDESRGLRIELLLATVKRDHVAANFLLLMPYVEKAETLARWLAHDVNAGRAISFGTTPWLPNERIVGLYTSQPNSSERSGWHLTYRTVSTTPSTIHLEGTHRVGKVKPLNVPKSKVTQALETAAMATVMSSHGTSIAVGRDIDSVWSMARKCAEALTVLSPIPNEIVLVQDFLRSEVSHDFELIQMLSHGVGVHHTGLSDDTRSLIEWLAEEGKLRVLCATTTIAQGINFPVSSVFLASRFIAKKKHSVEMPCRDFWNLAGRAGRMGQDSVGVVGVVAGKKPHEVISYLRKSTGELVSRLVRMLQELEEAGSLNNLQAVIHTEQWDDFRCYVAHLWDQKKSLDAVLADTEQLLRNTFGYGVLSNSPSDKNKAEALLEATKTYARSLANHPERTSLAVNTGFSPEGIGKAFAGLHNLERELTPHDWRPDGLFGDSSNIGDLYGVMLRIPQLAQSLENIGGDRIGSAQLAEITKAWVGGLTIKEIATKFFSEGGEETKAITAACKAIYRNLINSGAWGLSALSRLYGVSTDALTEADRRDMNLLPAMVYHGVRSEEAVLMRMNMVPRSISESLGKEYRRVSAADGKSNTREVRSFLEELDTATWERLRPSCSSLSGDGYRQVWRILSGDDRN